MFDPNDTEIVERLRSTDDADSQRAWSQVYDLLYDAGRRIANVDLAGEQYRMQREDLILTAIEQFSAGLINHSSDWFKQISTWNDCTKRMQTIISRRIKDAYGKNKRNREEATADPPEAHAGTFCGPPQTIVDEEDIWSKIERLDPPAPQYLHDRIDDGLTNQEIADRHGVKKSKVDYVIAEALKNLRGDLGGGLI